MATNLDINDFVGLFNATYEGPVGGAWNTELATVINTSAESVVLPGLNDVGGLAAWSSTRQKNTPSSFKVTITNTLFEDSIEIPKIDYTVDKLGFYSKFVQNMAIKARVDDFNDRVTTLISNGASTTCHDGQYYFDTDHPMSTGTQKNAVSATEIPAANIADGTTFIPTETEMASIIMQSVGYMQTLKGYGLKPINAGMRRVVIMSPTFLHHAAVLAAISKVTFTGAVSNGVTALQTVPGYNFEFVPVLNTALSAAPSKMYFFRADGEVSPFVLTQLGDINVTAMGPGSEYWNENGKALLGVDVARGSGYGRYQSALQVTLS